MAEPCSPGFCKCDCLCLLALDSWRWSTWYVGVLSSGWCPDWDPRQGPAGWAGQRARDNKPPTEQVVVPGGPWQYYAVQQYSVVRRVWGPGGPPVFLNFGVSRPPRNLMDVILTTPVRCISSPFK